MSDYLELVDSAHPLILSGSSNNLTKPVSIKAGPPFLEQVIVQGNSIDATLEKFPVEGINAQESGNDIVGGTSVHVYWDPQALGGDWYDILSKKLFEELTVDVRKGGMPYERRTVEMFRAEISTEQVPLTLKRAFLAESSLSSLVGLTSDK